MVTSAKAKKGIRAAEWEWSIGVMVVEILDKKAQEDLINFWNTGRRK